MIAAILLFLVGAAAVGWHLSRARERLSLLRQPAPETPLAYQNFQAMLIEDPGMRPHWTECPVCRCPTINDADDLPACAVCAWEPSSSASAAELAQARENFARYATVHSPEEVRQWGGSVPTEEEVQDIRSIVEGCRRAEAGEIPLHEWWEALNSHLWSLGEARLRRIREAERLS